MAGLIEARDPGAAIAGEALPALHIGLLWHTFLSGNLGVGALTIANLNLIAAAAQRAGYRPVFHVIGPRGEADYSHECPYEHDFTNVGYKAMVNPLSALHATFRACDIVFDIGAGDSFSDIYPWSRLNLILSSKVGARLGGARLVLSPQTIGPFFTGSAQLAGKGVMALASAIFARDEASFAVLEQMGFAGKSRLTTDVAFALPFTAPADKDSRDLAAGPIRVGLNVSALLYRRDLSQGDRIALAADYPALIDAILTTLDEDPRIAVHLVPHVLATSMPYEDDYAVAEMLKARFPRAVLPPRFAGPSEAKTYIADLDLLIGSRMHATIAAISSGTAVLPLGYSRKFNGLFGSLGYNWNSDLTAEENPAILARFAAAMADLPRLRAEAVAANAEAQRRLGCYVDFLASTFAELGRRHG